MATCMVTEASDLDHDVIMEGCVMRKAIAWRERVPHRIVRRIERVRQRFVVEDGRGARRSVYLTYFGPL